MANNRTYRRRRPKRYGKKRLFSIKDKKKLIIAGVALLLIAGIALFLFVDRPLSDEDKTLLKQTLVYRDGVSVAGVDLSGMTYDQALEAVRPAREQMHDAATIELVYEDKKWELTAGT